MAGKSKRSGGVNFKASDVAVAGDVAGRDINIYHYDGAAGSAARKAELPPRRPFFGREDELAQIANALKPWARTWGDVIDGAEGLSYARRAVGIYTKLRSPDLNWAQSALKECGG